MKKNQALFFQKGFIEIVNGKGIHEFPYHTHESFLIGVIKSGSAKFIIDNKEYVLGSGMTYLVPSDIGISIAPVSPYSYLTICIKKKVMQLDSSESEMYVRHDIGEKVIGLSKRFQMNRLTEDEFICELTSICNIKRGDEVLNQYLDSDIQKAVFYLKEHVNGKFVLNDLAEAVHLSKYHLIRRFKKEMGVTPKQYIQQCKIRQTKNRLLLNESEVDIAIDMNFSNQSHLCSMFKKYMGISMIEYKNNVDIV